MMAHGGLFVNGLFCFSADFYQAQEAAVRGT